MPDTPIDQSASIQSIRLKIPTGTVPIPPAGFGQLHSPSPGTLALRLPDGSVVPVGGGSGSATTLENERGLVTVEQVGVEPQAITIYPKPESNGQIKLAGSVTNQANEPFLPLVLRKMVLTAEQVAAAATTPPTVVTGEPGAVLVPAAFAAVYHYEAPPFVGSADYRFVWGDLNPDDNPLADQAIFAVTMFGAEQDMFWFSVAQPYGAPLHLASVVGQPIKMVASADLDSLAGTLDVYTWVRAVVV